MNVTKGGGVERISAFHILPIKLNDVSLHLMCGVRCSSVVRAFAHGALDRRIDPSWWISLFLVPSSVPRLV